MKRMLLVAVLAFLVPGGLAAQVFTPSYLPPRSSSDLGIYITDFDGVGDAFAVEGIWRQSYGGYDLGLRAGIGDARDAFVLLGGEYRNPLRVQAAPLDIAATGALQLFLGDGFQGFGGTIGLTVGHTFVPGEFSFTPYIHPSIGVVGGDFDGDVIVNADLGFDLAFGQGFIFRLGAGLGEFDGWGFGFAWR